MLEIIKYLKARYLSEKAQGITEYALLLLFVVAVAVAVLFGTGTADTLSNALNQAFHKVITNLTTDHT